MQAVDDDDVAFVKAVAYDAQAIGDGSEFYGAIFEGVVFPQDENVFLVEIGDYRFIFCQAGVISLAALQTDACEESGSEREIFICEKWRANEWCQWRN